MDFKTFGIVGYGHFGQFLARSLVGHGAVLVTDVDEAKLPTSSNGVRATTLAGVSGADVVIMAVPYASLEAVLTELRGYLSADTVVMDVVSTKARATRMLDNILHEHPNLMATHPLFGPPSMEMMGGSDQRLVVTSQRGDRAAAFREFLQRTFELQIVTIAPEEHDKAMAYMQSLPFFIARALVKIDFEGQQYRDILAIPSYEKLAEIAAIEEQHSVEMFDTSQISNPFAHRARAHFLEVLKELQDEIGRHEEAQQSLWDDDDPIAVSS